MTKNLHRQIRRAHIKAMHWRRAHLSSRRGKLAAAAFAIALSGSLGVMALQYARNEHKRIALDPAATSGPIAKVTGSIDGTRFDGAIAREGDGVGLHFQIGKDKIAAQTSDTSSPGASQSTAKQ